jgi:hypothetical protein
MSSSNLSNAVAALDPLSNSELEQLVGLIQIRLGKSASRPRKTSGQKATGKKKGGGGGKTAASKKGNPARKSQWAENAHYKEYMRLKKAVELEAKEGKVPFSAIDSDNSKLYRVALASWLTAKARFRTSGEAPEAQTEIGEAPIPGTEGVPNLSQGGGSATGTRQTGTQKADSPVVDGGKGRKPVATSGSQ